MSGSSGNAATRIAEFVHSNGSYAYGGYPDIDELFQQQVRERDPRKREALLHRIQQLTIDRVMGRSEATARLFAEEGAAVEPLHMR